MKTCFKEGDQDNERREMKKRNRTMIKNGETEKRKMEG